MAPEVAARSGHDAKADLWSVGSVLYSLLTGERVFEGDPGEVRRKSQGGAVDYCPAFRRLPRDARRFLRALLSPNPRLRPSAHKALEDPWLLRVMDVTSGEMPVTKSRSGASAVVNAPRSEEAPAEAFFLVSVLHSLR